VRGRSWLSLALLGTIAAAAWIWSGAAAPLASTEPELPLRVPAPLFDPKETSRLLEDPERDRWQQPARIVAALKLRPGATVADIGSGSGYLLPYLSRAVGPAGTVYAEEIQEAFLPALRRRAERLGNARVVLGTATDPNLPAGSIDCFVLLTVYHEIQDAVPFLRALRRAARPDARLAIIDFDQRRRGVPPAPIGHEVAARDVLPEARAAGWRLQEKHEFLSSQFFLVFRSVSPERAQSGPEGINAVLR
jgi:ubiquinone/menaquinone biosynthesis C-methylase UbiE